MPQKKKGCGNFWYLMKRIGELELSIYLKSLRGAQIIQTSGLLHYLEDEDYVNLTEINTCLISDE